MGRTSTFFRPYQCLESYFFDGKGIHKASGVIPLGKSCNMWVQTMQKTSGGRRPKKKIYYRVPELDRAMDLGKKPSLILQLKSIIQAQKNRCLLLRDLEKEVGFVQKWNFMAIIEKYPTIFRVNGHSGTPPMVLLTENAEKIAAEEIVARDQMEPILVKNLRKLLMLSIDCRLPLEAVESIQSTMGLPCDFKKSLIPKYPEYFSIKDVNRKVYLQLENWDSSLAVTAREERFEREVSASIRSSSGEFRISKDELQRWQKMEFPSPYLNARRFGSADPKARKRAVAVLHELLSLTMEKRMTTAQLDAFHSEYRLPTRLLLCLIKHHGIFYITNKGAKSTVFLKAAYDGSNLIEKCPLLVFWDKFIALSGRGDINSSSQMPSSQIFTDQEIVFASKEILLAIDHVMTEDL
ncbi:hypothetical protein NMG60_11037527 [Bertholletia excelsa]